MTGEVTRKSWIPEHASIPPHWADISERLTIINPQRVLGRRAHIALFTTCDEQLP